MEEIRGSISQIIGPVVDVHFDIADKESSSTVLPRIHDALTVQTPDGRKLVIEVQQHIGEETVRCVAMDSTDGLRRGLEVLNTRKPIAMPVGKQIRGRVMNVTWTKKARSLSTASPRNSKTSLRRRRCSLPASRLSTCWNLTSKVERLASSVAPAWARPCSSRS